MADVIKNAIIRLGIEQVPTKLEAPELAPVVDAYDRATDAIDRTAEEARKTADEVEDANLKILESSKLAGEGLFTMARGFTLLAVSGDESMRRVVEALALAQGAFDIFKGATDISKGLTEAKRALAAQSKATAAAESLDTAAKTANAAAARGAAVSNTAAAGGIAATGVAATASVGPVAALAGVMAAAVLPLTVLAVTIAAVYGAYKTLARNADEAEKSQRRLNRARREFVDDFNKTSRGRIGAATGRAEGLDGFVREEDRIARQEFLQRRLRVQQESIGRGLQAGAPEGSALRAAAAALEAATDLADVQQDRIRGAEVELRLAEQKNRAEIEAVKIADDRLQKAKEQLEVENERVESFRAQLGALSEIEQAELLRLAERAKNGGNLTNPELERLRQLGGGRVAGFVEGQFAQRGAGVDRRLEALGFEDNQQGLQAQVERLATELGKLTDGISSSEKIAQLEAERDTAVATAQATLDEYQQTFDRMLETIRDVQKRVEEVEDATR